MKRISLNILNKYEKTKIIGFRASQLKYGVKPLIDITETFDPFKIAEMELEAKVLPYKIRRPMPDGTDEIWDLKELVLIK